MTRGRKTGGRVAGTPNKATAQIRAIAGQYSAEAIGVLVELMRHSDDDRTRLVAAKELIDRAHGRPSATPADDPPENHRTIVVQWQNAEELTGDQRASIVCAGSRNHAPLLGTTVETTAP